MKIACLQNHPLEGPGLIAEWAVDRGHTIALFPGYEGSFPSPDEFDGLVVLGGPMSVNDAFFDSEIEGALRTVKGFLPAEKRVLGICLGAQMMALAAGGNVISSWQREIGWFPLDVHSGDPLFSELPDSTVVFHWHEEQIELPHEAQIHASTAVCPVQAFTLGPGQVGLQFHLEVTERLLEGMLEAFSEEMLEGGEGVQPPVGIMDGLLHHGEPCRRALFHLLDEWAR